MRVPVPLSAAGTATASASSGARYPVLQPTPETDVRALTVAARAWLAADAGPDRTGPQA
jgi:hypothetical protein